MIIIREFYSSDSVSLIGVVELETEASMMTVSCRLTDFVIDKLLPENLLEILCSFQFSSPDALLREHS